MRSLNKVVRHPSTRSCFLLTLFFLLSLISRPAVASLVLFDDDVQNGALLWSTSPSIADYTTGSEPVAAGTHAIAMQATNWTQAGLKIGQVAPAGHSLLQARIYRQSGSGGTLMFRYGSSWLKINLTDANNDKWTLDGQPGTSSYTPDTWHTIQIDLAALGVENESIVAIGVQGSSTTAYYFMDEVSFETPTAPNYVLFDDDVQNGAAFWSQSTSISELSYSTDPAASGTYSIAIEAASWSQAGLAINQTPPAGQTILEAKIYRVSGSGGSIVIRYGSSWTAITLNSTNNDKWTLDGQPGITTYTNDTWHTLQIDLAAFGLASQSIKAIGFKGSSTTAYYFMDDVAFVGTGAPEAVTPPIAGNWTLTFEDEFDGSYLDPEKWRIGEHWLGINGLAGNTPENIAVENGNLKMTAEKKTTTFGTATYNYATGEISTFKQFKQAYGYYEARIKYDAAQGVWPAFWLMPDRGNYGDQNYCRQSFIKFDISSTNQAISSAVLRFKIASAAIASNISIHRTLTDNWTQSSITWNNKPKFDPEWFAQVSGAVTGDWVEIDVTDYVQAQRSAGLAASFALVDTFMKDQYIQIHSKEASDSANRPQLVVNTLPVSASDDAYVRSGTSADSNFGTDALLLIKDTWGDTSSTYNGGMEFDIMESLGIWGDDVTAHALHWDGYGTDHQYTGSGELNLTPSSDGYHTYGMYWEPGYVAMYVDGVQTWSYSSSRVGSVTSYILLSLQMGGWDGNGTVIDSQLPADMFVDYVRVWSGTAD
ncbi:MAG: DNRLRE domain-containing protein [Phycisphaeraceae bacterium JB051]